MLRRDPCVAADPNAERRNRAAYPELSSGGPQRLLVLGSEIRGRWNEAAQQLVRDLAHARAQRAPPALRAAATSAWTRRWWATLAVAVQQAVSSTALGSPWPAPPHFRARSSTVCSTSPKQRGRADCRSGRSSP